MSVTRLRSFVPAADRRVREMREAAQLVLSLPLDDTARAGISEAVGDFTDQTASEWVFTMVSQPAARFIVKEIQAKSDRPDLTTRVWFIALTFAQKDTGLVQASRQRLAAEVGTTPEHISRALTALVDIGALIRETHGRRRPVYKVNSHIAWNGSEASRRVAAATAPRPNLKLVEA